MPEYWERAIEVIRECFGQRFVYTLATATKQGVNARSVYSFMHNDKMYVVSHSDTNKVREIADNPNVVMVYDKQKLYGTAKNIGHPLQPNNTELYNVIRRELGDSYNMLFNDNQPTLCVLEITPTRAVGYTQIHKYDVDFVNNRLLRERHYGLIPDR